MRGCCFAEGIGFAAIFSNDAKAYPEDSFENMRRFAEKHKFPFPYLHDESQKVAHAYDAVCTPDFFGFDRHLELQISRPARRGPHQSAAGGRAVRIARCHAAHRQNRPCAGPPNSLDRLLDQMEDKSLNWRRK